MTTTTAADADAACILPRGCRGDAHTRCSLGLHPGRCQAMGCAQFHFWRRPCLRLHASRVRHAIFDALPGMGSRVRPPSPASNRICRDLLARVCEPIVMTSNLKLAPDRDDRRCDLLESRLRRYHPRFQGAVRALAVRHPRIADLAASFPALLFALAVPGGGSILHARLRA